MASSPVDETRPLLSSTSDYGANESQATEVDVHVLRDVEYDTIPETSTVGRHLSWSSAYILVVSRVIGSGIFATPGIIVRQVGSIGITLLLFFIGSIIAACGLVVSLEYGCMLPRSGGENVYLEFTYRHPRFLASTLVAVQAVLLGFTASNCIIFGEYIIYACGIEPDERLQKTLALGLLTAITIVHGCFRKTGIIIQNSLGWIKVALALFMGFTGLYVVAFHPDQVPSMRGPQPNSDLWARLWEGSNWGWGIISTAIFKVLYSYAGLTNMNNVLNEVKDPIRTLKTVSVSSLDTACVLYLLVNVAYFLVVPLEEIKARPEVIAALFFDRVFSARVGGTLLPILIASSLAGNVMVVTFALARLNQEIARQGFLPFSRLLSSSRPFGAPMGGLIVHYIPSFLVIALPPRRDVYTFILDVEGYPGQFYALAVSIGLIWLRYTRKDIKRPFKAWLPAVWIRIVVCLVLIAASFFPPEDGKGDVSFFYATYAIVGVGIIIFGILYWYIWTVLLPGWKGYRLEEEVEVLEDGTSITKLVHVEK